uniref:Uncharacterized protein n=1 Tax=Caenorhabditis japonica TaxID=281687 RepID=A0A8R1EUR0_CAEJA
MRRNGSVRGRKNLVKNALLKFKNAESPNSGVVVYLTSCGVLRKSFDKCRVVTQIFEAFRVKFEIRDLNICLSYVEELSEKSKLKESGGYQKDLIFDSLPLVYVDGHFWEMRKR